MLEKFLVSGLMVVLMLVVLFWDRLKGKPKRFYFGLLLFSPFLVIASPFILFFITLSLILLFAAAVFSLVTGTFIWCFSSDDLGWFKTVSEELRDIVFFETGRKHEIHDN